MYVFRFFKNKSYEFFFKGFQSIHDLRKRLTENPLGFSVWTTASGRGVMLKVAALQQLFLLFCPLSGGE
jgi:hypothetical protein